MSDPQMTSIGYNNGNGDVPEKNNPYATGLLTAIYSPKKQLPECYSFGIITTVSSTNGLFCMRCEGNDKDGVCLRWNNPVSHSSDFTLLIDSMD
jgi:hypothetical protein